MDEKPDIVEFIETQCNIELFEWEKEFVRKTYVDSDGHIVIPYRLGFSEYRHLTYMLKELIIDRDRNTEIFKGE